MCGIAGFIGKSSNPTITSDLSTRLFYYLVERGHDASGFYAIEKENIESYKSDISSAKIINKKEWVNLWNMNPDVLLLHSRDSTSGDPKIIKNNHPFLSGNKKLALIHNGKIKNFFRLRNLLTSSKYSVESDCDSEVLLRLYQQYGLTAMLGSILWNDDNAAAIALADRKENHQDLFLFRDNSRPLYIVDMRESLNQIFFCSTDDIFEHAYRKSMARKLSYHIFKVQVNDLWWLRYNNDKFITARYHVNYDGDKVNLVPIVK